MAKVLDKDFFQYFCNLCLEKKTKEVQAVYNLLMPEKGELFEDIQTMYESYMAEYFEFTLVISSCENKEDFLPPFIGNLQFRVRRKDALNFTFNIGISLEWQASNSINVTLKDNYFETKDTLSLGFTCNLFDLISIRIKSKNSFFTYKIKYRSIQNVLIGVDDYLFLKNDRNSTFQQLSGEISIKSNNLAEWEKFIAEISGYEKLQFCIAPCKERVYENYYPFAINTSLASQLKFHFNARGFLFLDPTDKLKKEKLSYSKTDTHWTYLGAFIAFSEIIKKFQLDKLINNSDYEFFKSYKSGDLGSKFIPNKKSEVYYVKIKNFNVEDYNVFSNYHTQDGLISIYNNNNAKVNKSIIVFGDSFSRYWYPFISHFFQTSIFIRSAGCIIKSLLKSFSPDFVIIERAERFLLSSPVVYENINDCNLFFKEPTNFLLSRREEFKSYSGNVTISDYVSEYCKLFDI